MNFCGTLSSPCTTRPPLLSEFDYCLISEHYFESPGTIDLVFERVVLNPRKIHVYLAGPKPDARQKVGSELRARGLHVIEFSDNQEVLEHIGTEIIKDHTIENGVLISDLSSPAAANAFLAMQLSEERVLSSIIAITSKKQSSLRSELRKVGVRCIPGPLSSDALMPCLELN